MSSQKEQKTEYPPPPPSKLPRKRQRGWGKRNKNKPANPSEISILDGGWNGGVKLLDPARGAPAPPRNSEIRFRTGPGGTMQDKPSPVYVRNGPFPFKRLPTQLQLLVVECVLKRGGKESRSIWSTSRSVRDLCKKVEISCSLKKNSGSA